MTAPMRRLLACVREWPECETFGYDPRCCRFPKSCSCDCYDPATVNPEDLEPLSASVTLNSTTGPTDPPEPAERLSAAAVEGKATDGSTTGWESGDSSATDRRLVARCENYDERTGAPCHGQLWFRWGQADTACDTCGGRCGIAVARWERVVPTPTDTADELARVTRERDEALGRIAAAEQVQTRMAMSLPDHGPWQAWSERDRAVRDYEGDLSTALATETNPVERDALTREVEQLRAELEQADQFGRGEFRVTEWAYGQATKALEKHRTAWQAERDEVVRLRALLTRRWPIIQAAFAYTDSTADPTDTPHEDALLDAVNDYRALLGTTTEATDAQ